MKDWDQFAKTVQKTAQVSGVKPNPLTYMFIKATDNSLAIAVFLLTILFAFVGLFWFEAADSEKINWALHASELCLGVFLGLLKSGQKSS